MTLTETPARGPAPSTWSLGAHRSASRAQRTGVHPGSGRKEFWAIRGQALASSRPWQVLGPLASSRPWQVLGLLVRCTGSASRAVRPVPAGWPRPGMPWQQEGPPALGAAKRGGPVGKEPVCLWHLNRPCHPWPQQLPLTWPSQTAPSTCASCPPSCRRTGSPASPGGGSGRSRRTTAGDRDTFTRATRHTGTCTWHLVCAALPAGTAVRAKRLLLSGMCVPRPGPK